MGGGEGRRNEDSVERARVRDSPKRKSSIKKGSGGDDWMASAWMWSPKSFWPSNSNEHRT
jgi:hypothetical protein